MATVFDDQLLHSVLSGSAPTSKGSMSKIGEIGGQESQNPDTGENGENPLSPVPPYEEIDSSSSQQPQQPPCSPSPPSQLPVELEVRPVAQAEGADGLISAGEEASSPTTPPKSSKSQPPHISPFNPDSFRAINDPPPVDDSLLPGPTAINRSEPSGSTDSKSPLQSVNVPKPSRTPTPTPLPNGGPVILHNAIPLYALQRDPAPVDCPRCRTRNITEISHKTSTATHVWAATVGVAMCGLALAARYFVKGTKNVTHTCPNCKAKLATCMHSGRTAIHCHA